MQTLTITRGLPASGKSTWALAEVQKNKNLVRVNRDTIRVMLGAKWNPKHEKLVKTLRDDSIRSALIAGYDVINDDTNLVQSRMNELFSIATGCNAKVVVNDSFLNVSVEECIKRDAARQTSVGKDVILKLHQQYWKGIPKPVNDGPEEAILCDLDGTLALFGNANPYDRDFLEDECNYPVAQTLEAYFHRGTRIILMSGRDSKFMDQTLKWLDKFGIRFDMLLMRKEGDKRKDNLVKHQLYMENIQGRYKVLFILDDRPQVVRMWREELGLTVFQVAPDIEF